MLGGGLSYVLPFSESNIEPPTLQSQQDLTAEFDSIFQPICPAPLMPTQSFQRTESGGDEGQGAVRCVVVPGLGDRKVRWCAGDG